MHGYRVSAFEDGLQAVRYFQQQSRNIKLVLLDMIIPEISGPQVYQELKRSDPEVIVIFMSGYCEDKTVQDLLAYDRTTFLRKPFAFDKLLATIAGTLLPREVVAR